MSTWEERMAQQSRRLGRAGARPYDRDVPPKPLGKWNLVEGEWLPIPPDQDPPEDHGMCTDCFEWRRYPPGQEHFGFAWWRTCNQGCGHDHHDDEVWYAAAPPSDLAATTYVIRPGCEPRRAPNPVHLPPVRRLSLETASPRTAAGLKSPAG